MSKVTFVDCRVDALEEPPCRAESADFEEWITLGFILVDAPWFTSLSTMLLKRDHSQR